MLKKHNKLLKSAGYNEKLLDQNRVNSGAKWISGSQKENMRSKLTMQINGMRGKFKSKENEKGKGFTNYTHAQAREFYIIVLLYEPLQ